MPNCKKMKNNYSINELFYPYALTFDLFLTKFSPKAFRYRFVGRKVITF